MLNLRRLNIILTVAVLAGGCTLPFASKKQAALQVNAQPQGSVYLNDKHVGQTPYFDEKLKAGEYTVKVAVENDSTKDWQTTITLVPRIVTIVSRQFGNTPEESAHYILQLEPLTDKEASEISIVTVPDNVIVKLDGQPQGFSPVALDDITAGTHTLTLAAPGHQELTIQAQTKAGYKLIVTAQLGKSPLPTLPPLTPESTQSGQLNPLAPTPTPTTSRTTATASSTLKRPYVEIGKTDTGWLRVRSEPNGYSDNEVAKLDAGVQVRWLETNEGGWYKVEYEPGKYGWISARYATLYR